MGIAIAVQEDKGTPATVNTDLFIALSYDQFSAPGIYDYIENQNQNRGIHGRASTQQASPTRTGFKVNLSGSGNTFCNSLGALLIAVGYLPGSPSGTAPTFLHTFTKMDICDAPWVTLAQEQENCGIGVTPAVRKLSYDARLTSLVLNLATTGNTLDFTGIALDEQSMSAYPTSNILADSTFALSPVTGSLVVSGVGAWDSGQAHTITVARPLDEEDKKMHSIARADAQETGWDVMGSVTGMDMDMDLYEDLVLNDGLDPDGPGSAIITSSVGLTLTDGQASDSEQMVMSVVKADVRFTNFTASGIEKVRCDCQWKMIDDLAASPMSIALTNSIPSYGMVAP